MDQFVAHKVVFVPIVDSAKAVSTPRPSAKPAKPTQPGMLAKPSARNFRFARATATLVHAGQRLALIVRRVGQPADTFTGPVAQAPEDVRARYQSGVFGVTEAPRSLRDAGRRW